ncbi:MAG: NAD(P)H-dependent oxidoreductase subunit E [Desulfarculales bacterium]|jgi:NADH-quinone oxidoreductase subunit E|nr:NAD(P)H-dependent oxidoreductase subunit E [Desulfarculales bacterium]
MAEMGKQKSPEFEELDGFIKKSGLEGKQSALIAVLHQAQHIFGYLPKEVMMFIGKKLQIPVAKIYGVVTFYSFFNTEPKGRNQFKVCLGTACFVRGSDKIADALQRQLGMKMGETSEDLRYSLEAVRCVGACGLAPVVLVNDKVYGRLLVKDINKIIDAQE